MRRHLSRICCQLKWCDGQLTSVPRIAPSVFVPSTNCGIPRSTNAAKHANASSCDGMTYRNGAASAFIPRVVSTSQLGRRCNDTRLTLDVGERLLPYRTCRQLQLLTCLAEHVHWLFHANASSNRMSMSSCTRPWKSESVRNVRLVSSLTAVSSKAHTSQLTL